MPVSTPDLAPKENVARDLGTKPKTAVFVRATPKGKRLCDIVGACALIILLLPLFVLVAAYIKCVSKGPVLFVQKRLGRGCDLFSIYKFRTMHVVQQGREAAHRQYLRELSQDGRLEKPNQKSELIPGGKLLRRSSIDELPQLLNVLIGNMSLVGPRPDVLAQEDYEPWHLRRFEVVPGMTGLWQVSGKNSTTFNEMMELDIRYIDEQSLVLDISIVFRTFKVLLVENNE